MSWRYGSVRGRGALILEGRDLVDCGINGGKRERERMGWWVDGGKKMSSREELESRVGIQSLVMDMEMEMEADGFTVQCPMSFREREGERENTVAVAVAVAGGVLVLLQFRRQQGGIAVPP